MLVAATCLAPVSAWAHVVDAAHGAGPDAATPLVFLDLAPPPARVAATTSDCPAFADLGNSRCDGANQIRGEFAPAGWDLASVRPAALPPAGFATRDLAPSSLDLAHIGPADGEDTAPAETAIGPASPHADQALRWADHVPRGHATHRGFWQQAGTVKTETLLFLGYFALTSSPKFFKETESFHFKDEGWFGKGTENIGVDKLTHAFNTYLIAEILHSQIHKRTNASEGDAITAAVLASGLMALNELSDGIEPDSGYSMQDIAMNLAGAGFSVLRNTVPGLKEKLAFKLEIVPNSQIYSHRGKPHYAQQRFMLSLKGAGFKELEKTPLRYLDLQVGYYASDFLHEDRAAGLEPKRHLFVGLGLNVGELLFGKSRSGLGKAAHTVLDYLQLPYTSVRYDTTGRLGN